MKKVYKTKKNSNRRHLQEINTCRLYIMVSFTKFDLFKDVQYNIFM